MHIPHRAHMPLLHLLLRHFAPSDCSPLASVEGSSLRVVPGMRASGGQGTSSVPVRIETGLPMVKEVYECEVTNVLARLLLARGDLESLSWRRPPGHRKALQEVLVLLYEEAWTSRPSLSLGTKLSDSEIRSVDCKSADRNEAFAKECGQADGRQREVRRRKKGAKPREGGMLMLARELLSSNQIS